MIDEESFIKKIKSYDNSGLEFDSLDAINNTIKGTMLPIKKRGINDNEFTIINIAAQEKFNNDLVLNLFNDIPPGPKLMERHRTHLIVGRYSQSIVLPTIVVLNGNKYLLVQKRNPANYEFEESTEIYRDYVEKLNETFDIKTYVNKYFSEVVKVTTTLKLTPCGYFWEGLGIMGGSVYCEILHFEINSLKSAPNDIEKLFNDAVTQMPKTIQGKRVVKLVKLTEALNKSNNEVHFLDDLISQTGLFLLQRNNPKLNETIVQ